MFDVVALGELLIDFAQAGTSDSEMRLFEQNPGARRPTSSARSPTWEAGRRSSARSEATSEDEGFRHTDRHARHGLQALQGG